MKNKKTFITELDQRLASRKHENKEIERHELSKNKIDLRTAWEDSKKEEISNEEVISKKQDVEYYKSQEIERLLQKDKKEAKIKKRKNTMKLIFALAVLSILAILFFISKDYLKNNLIRKDNVDITFFGPNNISSFEPFSLDAKVENKTGADITDSTLAIYYPEGTLNKNFDDGLVNDNFNSPIKNNSFFSKKLEMILLGTEASEKKIKYNFKYHLAGKNKDFQKTGEYSIKINSSPIHLNFIYPKVVNSKVPKDIIIEIKSNASKDIQDISVVVDVDNIFSINSSSPAATSSNNVFYFKNIKAGEIKSINLNGFFTGTVGEGRVINVRLMKNFKNNKDKFISKFIDDSMVFTIQKKDIDLDISARKNNLGEIIFHPERSQTLNIDIVNNLPKTIFDVKTKISISGNFFEKTKVRPISGFYDSNNNFILWDKNTYQHFGSIDPNRRQKASASMTSLPISFFAGKIKNPETKFKIDISTKNSTANPHKITYTEDFVVKLNSIYKFSEELKDKNGKIVYEKGESPLVGVPKMYRLKWSLSSSTNDIHSPKVSVVLPHYVRLVSKSPDLYYNDLDRTLTWTPRIVKAFSGYNNHDSKEIEFIIEYIPTIPHIRNSVALTTNKTMEGLDSFTLSNYKVIYPNTMTSAIVKKK